MNNILKKAELSSDALFSIAAKWFFIAAISFIFVMLFHQFLVGGLSRFLGYETHIHFAKVESLPHYDAYWSTGRVLILYALPGMFIFLISIVLLNYLYFGGTAVTIGKWIAFWVMVFCVLVPTTLLSISFFYTFDPANTLFQGFAVLVYWFRSSVLTCVLFIILSWGINLVFGFICAHILFDMMPILIRKRGKAPRVKLLASFYYPIIIIFILSAVISIPHGFAFFIAMFLHAVLWLPGFYFINPTVQSEGELKMAILKPYYIFGFLIIIVLLAIIIRTFLY